MKIKDLEIQPFIVSYINYLVSINHSDSHISGIDIHINYQPLSITLSSSTSSVSLNEEETNRLLNLDWRNL